MNLLKAALYDPAVAVSKATSALLAMTALDTTNLRLAITVPAHGMVRFRMRCAIVGATTCPVILLGVMNGATVVGRVQPVGQPVTAPAATQVFIADAEFTATGLAAGAMNVDAAYAVQVLVASTNIKYGGPNTNAGANAWGAFVFEAWDPQPITANSTLAVDANGRVDVIKVAGTTQTARDLGASVLLAANQHVIVDSGTVTTLTNLPSIPANWLTAAGIAASALNGKGDWMLSYTQPTGFLAATFPSGTVANTTNITAGTITTATNLTNAPTSGDLTATMKTSVTTACTASTPTAAAVTGAVGSVTGNVGGNVAGSVASVTAAVSVTGDLSATMKTSVTTAATAATPIAASVTGAVGSVTGNVGGNVTGSVGSVTGLTASDVGAIKAKTDSLNFTVAGKLDVNVLYVNGIAIVGNGSSIPFNV